MKINSYSPIIPTQKIVPPMPIGKSFEEALKDISAIHAEEKCKYMLPCGWCEKRHTICFKLSATHNDSVAQSK